uniref:Hexosyltransferase n=1 Tax=Poecilia latipinna TaxID=48699 RepID=A0A3B3VQF8_9TELE
MLRRWLLALMARIGLITSGCCCFLLLFYLLGCKPSSHSKHPSLLWPGGATSKEGYLALLQEREDSHRHYISSLMKQIAELKVALEERTQQLQESLEKAKIRWKYINAMHCVLQEFFRSQLKQAEVSSGVELPNEYALIPFDTFTLQTVYQLETGLTKHPAERPARRDRRDELIGTVETALHVLNGPQQQGGKGIGVKNILFFVSGLSRTERTRGTVYELMFKGDGPQNFAQLVLFRPFGPLMKVKSDGVNTHGIIINIIVPLSGRVDAFKQFMSNFRDVCIQQDGRVHLTVVYFGRDQINQVKAVKTNRTFAKNILVFVPLKRCQSRSQ